MQMYKIDTRPSMRITTARITSPNCSPGTEAMILSGPPAERAVPPKMESWRFCRRGMYFWGRR